MKVDARIVGVSRVGEIKASAFKSHWNFLLFLALQLSVLIGAMLKISVIKSIVIVSAVGLIGLGILWFAFRDSAVSDE